MDSLKATNLKSFPAAASILGISTAGLRWIRHRSVTRVDKETGRLIDPNGFASAFFNVGRRVFVDINAFYAIVTEQNAAREQLGAQVGSSGRQIGRGKGGGQ